MTPRTTPAPPKLVRKTLSIAKPLQKFIHLTCLVCAAGHELRSVTRVVDSGDAAAEGVAVPLITLVDYRYAHRQSVHCLRTEFIHFLCRGYRLTAVSLLPVSKKTIIYG